MGGGGYFGVSRVTSLLVVKRAMINFSDCSATFQPGLEVVSAGDQLLSGTREIETDATQKILEKCRV